MSRWIVNVSANMAADIKVNRYKNFLGERSDDVIIVEADDKEEANRSAHRGQNIIFESLRTKELRNTENLYTWGGRKFGEPRKWIPWDRRGKGSPIK
jgi:hypothetical protein